ncbi:DNA polymerase III subunit delta' [Chengkuizengella axinellae]|uniref:DNA polymerase III subunit delta n=1 Tax=Chengkuizengella axinellae TaxID=3064388 RepID=A0ABT9J622_9BACL|nr:DNA polymerase III subunit delta' [Chengkuizengella sp. 2205SS18-9]MDP5276928.1 DNA polymerase III subunit delta' [Chengkuizengella sp. 2205SS18-9]
MSFHEIMNQTKVKQKLQNGLKMNKVSHAYLFTGPSGTGKRKMALNFAKAIFCIKKIDDACDQCIECKKFEHGNHPQLRLVEPDGNHIKIEQIRELQKNFSYKMNENQTKIYILFKADRLTTQAANSLLKFLEEPSSNVVAVLIADNGQAVLPTIRSRSQWISFQPQLSEKMAEQLIQEGFASELVNSGVRLTSGLEEARELIQLNSFAEIRGIMIQLAKESLNKFSEASITAQQKIFKSNLTDELNVLLDLFILWFKDIIQIQCGKKDKLVFEDQIPWLEKNAFTRQMNEWVQCMEIAINTKKKLRFNVNPQLALDQFMIQIKGG